MNLKNLMTIILATLLFACTKTDPNQVTITGEITNPKGESVTFSNQDTSYSTSANEDGSFVISFNLDSATNLNFEHGVEHTAMYVKPGDKIKLSIDTEKFDETIKYEGSEESSFLAKLYLLSEENDFLGEVFYLSNVKEYKAILDTFREDVLEEFGTITDSIFIKDQISGLDKNIDYFIERQEKLAEYSDDVKHYMWETKELGRNFNFYAAMDSLNSEQFSNMLEAYSAKFLALLSKVTDSDFIIEAKERIAKTTSNWGDRKTAIDNMPQEGEPAIDFTYPDKDGNEFSLASFKGTLIYVDVWATWCGPCKAEIPYLQKLEEEYQGYCTITFLSVSVDTDKDAWLKMVKEKELGGTQLWADGWSEITKSYAIFGIPRFMLFSADGNVISTNAPRPSSDEIRGLLNANLGGLPNL
ncbi:MAG TPA: redoxin domain-containing protein [Flavobacteriales bacterium]|nr:redoxin domain-containing protein [Flavobacteriales bacterium]